MASENLTAAGYIKHHLQSLTQDGHSQGLKNVADFSYIHLDTMFFSVLLGAVMCFILWRGAKAATVGVPGRFQAAIELGVDAFITGEVSEAQYHLAHETGVAFLAAGHHASERYGVQALAAAIKVQFGLPVVFFDEANPV